MDSKGCRKLAVFDFDHTIINENSDIYINKLLIRNNDESSDFKRFKFPIEIEKMREKGWTNRMNAVFEYMHSIYNINKSKLIDCLEEIKVDDCMLRLIDDLYQRNYHLFIISDSNTIFIETILKQNGIYSRFNTIFTNKASFDLNEKLVVVPFNHTYNPNKEPFDCQTNICEKNICKGKVLDNIIKNHDAEHIIYVGDGTNDYCPGLYLTQNDNYFVRKDFSLFKLLKKEINLYQKLTAKIKYWSNADDILYELKNN
jgi:pyridoxal phosphate phosphatase PHOSPHO2